MVEEVGGEGGAGRRWRWRRWVEEEVGIVKGGDGGSSRGGGGGRGSGSRRRRWWW